MQLGREKDLAGVRAAPQPLRDHFLQSQLPGVSCQGPLKSHSTWGRGAAAYLLTFQNRCNLTNRVLFFFFFFLPLAILASDPMAGVLSLVGLPRGLGEVIESKTLPHAHTWAPGSPTSFQNVPTSAESQKHCTPGKFFFVLQTHSKLLCQPRDIRPPPILLLALGSAPWFGLCQAQLAPAQCD